MAVDQFQTTGWLRRLAEALATCRSWVGFYCETAHEAVHCLNPSVPSGPAMYIEEAIAVQFRLDVVRRIFGQRGVDTRIIWELPSCLQKLP